MGPGEQAPRPRAGTSSVDRHRIRGQRAYHRTLLRSRGRLIPMSTHAKLANKSQERPSLQHELLAFSGFPELRQALRGFCQA